SLAFAVTDEAGRLLATTTVAELLRVAKQGCPQHPASTDDADGAGCDCPVLGPPPATDAYPPTNAQRRFVKTRDKRCRFPNCGHRTGWADLDHVLPHACDGPTDCTNLCCLCRSHRVSLNANRGVRCRS
ncbi:MAG TPA: HNH endonuclease signature motif containing protein, partial [Gemmatimonadales bacterium]|nr:HNH endonuclease signature motif containing protein [Gemmatimonadales bacterium]